MPYIHVLTNYMIKVSNKVIKNQLVDFQYEFSIFLSREET